MSKPSVSASARDIRTRWIKRIKDEQEAHKDWIRQAEDAESAYFVDHHKTRDRSRSVIESYPLFPSTIKVIHGRVFSQPPKPDVRKRYANDASSQPNPPVGGVQGVPAAGGPPSAPSGAPPAAPPAPAGQPGAAPVGAMPQP